VGSVLYQIRMLHRHYIKDEDYDVRWVGKYVSAPWEAAALAAVVFSVIHGVPSLLEGSSAGNFSNVNDYGAFGVGGLIGFGVREVIGWPGNLVTTMFPTNDTGKRPQNSQVAKRQKRAR